MIRTDKIFDEFIENFKLEVSNNTNGNILLTFSQNVDIPNIISLLDNLQSLKHNFFFWQKPDEKCLTLGIDSVINIKNSGKERTLQSEKEINFWKDKRYSNLGEDELKSIPLFMGGMKFSPDIENENTLWKDFGDSDWFVPKYLIKVKDGITRLIFNFKTDRYDKDSLISEYNNSINFLNSLFEFTKVQSNVELLDSNLSDIAEKIKWTEKVNSALEKIAEKNLTKIVLSRKVTCKLSGVPLISNSLTTLAENYPRCYIFAFAKGESIFFGASPEKLAKISNGWVEADALAGSTPRGTTEEEDIRLANELLASKKNLAEQNAVVEFIKNSFNEFTTDLTYNRKPTIRKLSNIQHLWTEIKAKLKSDNSIFSILKEIHPTPAICGVPWSDALTFIETTEGYNRGLYAGIIGWFNFDNQGEFAVAIRSALLKGKELHAFAGCGIVEGSDPDSEFEESELKLQPILSLFPNEKIYQS